MTIRDHIRRHESSAEWHEGRCAGYLLRGDSTMARYAAETAAYERHLAREFEDTNTISIHALIEFVDERKVARA